MNSFVHIFVVWVVFLLIMFAVSYASAKAKGNTKPIFTRKNDVTCASQYGHHHETDATYGPRYVVAQVPEKGYVILNGVKRSIKECKDL